MKRFLGAREKCVWWLFTKCANIQHSRCHGKINVRITPVSLAWQRRLLLCLVLSRARMREENSHIDCNGPSPATERNPSHGGHAPGRIVASDPAMPVGKQPGKKNNKTENKKEIQHAPGGVRTLDQQLIRLSLYQLS